MIDENTYLKIEAYLGGDMTPEEQAQFETMIAQDSELQKEVELSNQINHYLNDEAWLANDKTKNSKAKQELEDYIKSDEAAQIKSKIQLAGNTYKEVKNKSSKIQYFIGAIAAVFIVGLLVTSLVFNKTNNDDLYAAYYSTDDLPSLVKRGVDNNELNSAIIEFKNKDYEKAIHSFQEYQDKSQEDEPLLNAYIGFSYLELDMPEEALKNFDILLNSDIIDSSKALWYKSLVYMKIGDTKNLKSTLSTIISNPENFNHKKAIQLQEKLD